MKLVLYAGHMLVLTAKARLHLPFHKMITVVNKILDEDLWVLACLFYLHYCLTIIYRMEVYLKLLFQVLRMSYSVRPRSIDALVWLVCLYRTLRDSDICWKHIRLLSAQYMCWTLVMQSRYKSNIC